MGSRGRDWQPGQRGHRSRWRLVDWAATHSHADKLGGTAGNKTGHTTQDSRVGK